MELRHLRYFVAVAEKLHVTRAAEWLHVAQPAVSEQIRRLERDLGVDPLDRTGRRIALTDAGRAFLAEARRVLDDAQHARLAARSALIVAACAVIGGRDWSVPRTAAHSPPMRTLDVVMVGGGPTGEAPLRAGGGPLANARSQPKERT